MAKSRKFVKPRSRRIQYQSLSSLYDAQIRKPASERRKAGMMELRLFYTRYVCKHTCPSVVKLMSSKELIRLIVISIYKREIIDKGIPDRSPEKTLLIHKIYTVIPVGKSMIYACILEAKANAENGMRGYCDYDTESRLY